MESSEVGLMGVSSTGDPSTSAISISTTGRIRVVNMTGLIIHRNGYIRINPDNGSKTIVALSSMALVLGSSPATVKGARIIAALMSVPNQ